MPAYKFVKVHDYMINVCNVTGVHRVPNREDPSKWNLVVETLNHPIIIEELLEREAQELFCIFQKLLSNS